MKNYLSPVVVAYTLGLAVLIAAPAFVYPLLVSKVLCFALFASAFNLLLGYTGLLSFGHAAFFGTASYITAYGLKIWALPTLLAILLGALAAALLGWVIGTLAIRRRGIYFSMITLALAQMVFFIYLQAPFTGGEDGLRGVPRGSVLGVDLNNDTSMYYLVVMIFCSAFWLLHRATNSPFGDVLRAIRENETRAISLGYDVAKYKLLAFILSAAISGLAGASKAVVFGVASLSDVNWHTSGEVILMTLLGGSGTVMGPAIGAAFLVELQTQLADKVGSLVTLITGVIFIFCVMVFRSGIVGGLETAFARFRSKSTR